MKKQCIKCNTIKDRSCFYKRPDRNNNKEHSYCKECFNDYCQDRWKKKRLKAIDYKGGKCIDCGYNECIAALEFHHLDPKQKEFSWQKMRLKSEIVINKELDKCVLLCANCHRKRHYGDLL